jgi:hypothetical protein
MIDVKLPIRKAFYQLLNGALNDPSANPVNVYDAVQKLADQAMLYVLLENQTSIPTNNQVQFASHEDITLSIVQRNPARVARSQVDYIASQILGLVLPNQGTNGLPTQFGVQFLDVQVAQDTYQTFYLENNDAVVRRLITFEMDCYQTGGAIGTPAAPLFDVMGMLRFTQADFTSATTLPIPQLAGQKLAVYLNGVRWFDGPENGGIDFTYLPGGGINVTVPGFDATTHNYVLWIAVKAN